MPTMADTTVPDDIERKDLTAEQAAFLKRTFARQAPDEGLEVSFTETLQDDGLTTLLIHFSRPHVEPAAALGAAAAGSLAWGAKVSAAFRDKVRAIAATLGTDPSFLMAAMAFETGRGFDPAQLNHAGSGAVGLIQFMPKTAVALQTTSAALAGMTAETQLDFVEKYFAPFKGRLHNLSDLYMAILWPVAVPKPDDFVLFSQNLSPTAYNQNKGLDLNGDGKVTKAEAASKVAALLTEGMKAGNVA